MLNLCLSKYLRLRLAPASEFNGFSGTRRAIGKIIRKDLLIIYPEISIK